MSSPRLKFEVAFGTDPGSASPIWTDLSHRVRQLEYTRGKQRSLARHEAATIMAVLDNRDRALDPFNTSSPYYPNVVPNRRCRVRALYPGVNLLTPQQSSVEDSALGTTGLVPWGGTILRSTAQAADGVASIQVTASGGSTAGVTHSNLEVPARAGVTYKAYAEFRQAGATVRNCNLEIAFFNAAGSALLASYAGATAMSSSEWRAKSVNATAPANTAYMRVLAYVGDAAFPDAGEVFYIDKLMLTDALELSWEIGSTYYNLATGFVSRWPQRWEGRDAVAVLEAGGPFKILASQDLPGSVYAAEVLTDTPRGWYRLGEQYGTIMADSSGNRRDGAYYNGAVFYSRQGLVAEDPSSAILFDVATTGAPYGRVHDSTLFPTAFPFTIEGIFQAPPLASISGSAEDRILVAAASVDVAQLVTGNQLCYVRMECGGTGLPGRLNLILIRTSGTEFVQIETIGAYDDNQLHHFMVVMDSSTTGKFYIDGVDVTGLIQSTGSFALPTLPYVHVGSTPQLTSSAQTPFRGIVDEIAFYGSALSAARATAHAKAMRQPWEGDLSGQRIGRILDAVGWPAAERSVDTGKIVLGMTDLTGKALPLLERVAESEMGALLETTDGKIRFRNRHGKEAAPYTTLRATLTDGVTTPTPSGCTYDKVEPIIRYDEIVNVARLKARGGPQVEGYENAASRARYFTQTYEAELDVRDMNDLRATAQAVVFLYAEPSAEFDVLDLSSDAGLPVIEQMVTRDLEDLVLVERTPPGGGAAISRRARIQGIRVLVDSTGDHPNHWSCRWWLSSVDVVQTGGTPYMVLDTGTLDGARVGY